MKKFKSLCIFVLVFIMLSGMTACGGSKNSNDQTGKSTTKGQTTNGQTTGKSSASSTTKGTSTANGTSAASTTQASTTDGTTAQGTTSGSTDNGTSAGSDVYPENGLSKTEQVTLKMGFFEGGVGRAFMDYAVQTFTERFPNVSIEITASPTIENIIMPKISAGNDDDMFDIFSTTRLQWDELADAGKIVTMTDLWERSPYDTPGASLKDLFISTSYKYNRFKRMGNTYAIDYGLDVMGLFYDKAFFQKNGWNEQPQTYDEFMNLCAAIKKKGIFPITFYRGYQWGLFKPKEFEMALENGNYNYEYNFRNFVPPLYTSPESLTMWTRMYDMGKKGYFEPGSGTITNIISQMQLIQHRSAMVASGSWIQNEMKNSTPAGFQWGFMAMPFTSNPDSKLCVQQAAEDTLLVWAGKPELNIKWAKEFILWMQNLDVQTEIVRSGMMSIRSDFSSDPNMVNNLQGVCRTITDVLASGRVMTVDILSRDVVMNDPNGYGDEAWKIADESRVAVALGKKDPVPMLQQCEELLQKAVAAGIKQ